jgi:precorrin-4 C11-methyltransferase
VTERAVAVYFIGAGPGALDLMTVRAQRLIQEADLILYADSLVNPEIATLARPEAEVVGSAAMTLEEILDRMIAAARAGRIVARVHSGDPSVYGAIREQMAGLVAAGVGYEVVPGVSSLFGAAAELGIELTVPELSQTIIITRAEGRTPVPDTQRLRGLAAHRATMAIYLSVGSIDAVVAELLEGGYRAETPAAVVYRATWPDQQILRGRLSDIAEAVRASGITRQALILVGDAVRSMNDGVSITTSLLYDPTFDHGYRGRA